MGHRNSVQRRASLKAFRSSFRESHAQELVPMRFLVKDGEELVREHAPQSARYKKEVENGMEPNSLDADNYYGRTARANFFDTYKEFSTGASQRHWVSHDVEPSHDDTTAACESGSETPR